MSIKDLIYHDIEGVEDFIDVVDVDFGGGYDWDEFHAWYSPSKRRYFWAEGSGCSCSYFGEDLYKLDDFSSGSTLTADGCPSCETSRIPDSTEEDS